MTTPRTPRTPRSLQAVRELLDWDTDTTFQGNMKTYGIWTSVEWCVLLFITVLVEICLEFFSHLPSFLPLCLLLVPLTFVALRGIWLARLSCQSRELKDIGIRDAIRRLNKMHSWYFYSSCSGEFWRGGSAFLMVWHALLAVIIFSGVEEGHTVEMGIGAVLFVLALVNLFLWTAEKEEIEDPWVPAKEKDPRVQQLRKMYENSKISLMNYSTVVSENENAAPKCVVCLEDFRDDEEVARLPCGHVFHPHCSHLWVRNHWNCPLRCNIGLCGTTVIGAERTIDLEAGNAWVERETSAVIGDTLMPRDEGLASLRIAEERQLALAAIAVASARLPQQSVIATLPTGALAGSRLRRLATCPTAIADATTPLLLRRSVTFQAGLEVAPDEEIEVAVHGNGSTGHIGVAAAVEHTTV